MYQIFKHIANEGLGTAGTIRIDFENGVVSKQYVPGGLTCSGRMHCVSDSLLQTFFDNEVYFLKKLKGSIFLPRLLSVDCESRTIFQEYHLPDLLTTMIQGEPFPANLGEMLLEMYRYFKREGVFKRNGALSNMTLHNGQLKAFDFKWSTPRPLGKELELHSYRAWLSKIDSSLPDKLIQLID